MGTGTITAEAETILVDLNNSLYLTMTPEILSRLHQGVSDLDAVLDWLIDYGYISLSSQGYELTFAGTNLARELQAKQQGCLYDESVRKLPLVQTARSTQYSENDELLYTHPLRSSTRHFRDKQTTELVSGYLLVFASFADTPPLPVLDGDVVGRLKASDICLSDDEIVSGRHCQFHTQQTSEGVSLFIEDLGSRNGTYLNDIPLQPCKLYPLVHGSKIKIGSNMLSVIQL